MRLWLSFSQSYHIQRQDARANCCSFPQTYNQIRQIRSGTTLNIPNSATYTELAAGDTLANPGTSAHIAGTQAGQIRARAAGVQDHRQQDRPERRQKWRYRIRERSCYLVKVTLLQKVTQKKPAAGCREKQNKKGFWQISDNSRKCE